MALNEKTKKGLTITLKVLSWVLVAFAVLLMVFTLITKKNDENKVNLFGYRFYIVLSDSMSKSELNANLDVHFDAGDIIISKIPSDPTKLKEGQIISFISTNIDSYGKTITHMIKSVRKTSTGKVIGYETYGTNKGESDTAIVEPEFVLGVYAGKIPDLGKFMSARDAEGNITTEGAIGFGVIMAIIFAFIAYLTFNLITNLKEYKAIKGATVEAEKAADKKEKEDLQRELELLKAQLAKQNEEKSKEE